MSTRTAIGLCLLNCVIWNTIAVAAEHQQLAAAIDREAQIKKMVEVAAPATVAVGNFSSGVVVSEDGFILTAAHNHLVDESQSTVRIIFHNGRTAKAKRLGCDFGRDLGLLKIVGSEKWPHIGVAADKLVQPGDWCIALGYPGGYGSWRRTPSVRVGRVNRVDGDQLVTDCATCSGDSGGPLLNLSGQVIGIHTSIGQSVAENRHVSVRAYADVWKRLLRGDRWGTLSGQVPRSTWDEKATRGRELHELEKQHTSVLREFAPLAKSVRQSVVSIEAEDQTVVAWGTVIDHMGGIVTKASELNGAKSVTCIFSDGSRHSAPVVYVEQEQDLALIVLEAVETSPVKWTTSTPAVACTVVTPTPEGHVACIGVVSHPALRTTEVFRRNEPEWFRPQMIRIGAVPSRRLAGFPSVIQHDSPLYPEQCGGPLLNLNGETIGINIARFGRVESFALPAHVAQAVIGRIKARLENGGF